MVATHEIEVSAVLLLLSSFFNILFVSIFFFIEENPLVRTFGKKKWQHWKTAKELKQFSRKGLPVSHRGKRLTFFPFIFVCLPFL